MTTKTDPGIIDAEVIDVTYDDEPAKPKAHNITTPKRGMAGQLQRHVQNLSPERKMALKSIAKKGGIIGLAAYAASLLTPKLTDQFAGEGDGKWACKPPERNRTSYYPVTGNGDYDDVSGVDKLDAETDTLNKTTFGYDPESIRSFHNFSCVDGCVDALTEPAKLSADTADRYFSDVHDLLGDTISALNASAEEPWVQTLIQQRYSTLSDRQDEVETISTACGKMLGSSNNAATEAHSLLRNTIKKNRADLAHGYANGQSGFSWTATAAGAAAGLKKGVIGAGVGALGAGLVSGLWGDHFPDDVKEALDTRLDDAASKAKNALQENDTDVERFKSIVDSFGSDNLPGDVFTSAKSVLGGLWDKVTGAVDDFLPDHIPGGDTVDPLGTPSDTTPISPLGTDTPTSPSTDTPPGTQTPSTNSPLGNVQTPSMPNLGSSPLGTSPMSTPTTPTSAMTPQSFDQLMGTQPETAATPELFDGTEVPSDDTSSDSGDTDTSDKSDDSDLTDPETVSDDDTKDDTSDGEVVTDDAAPVTDGHAPAEPTDEQKRTVELPDGRSVTFPNEKLADMVRTMAASNPENPVTLYDAASKAGLTLPPVGTDIGTPVPPMDVAPGDVIVGADGTGVAIGDGEVLMESGEIRPVEDVAKVDSAGHGIFRLETVDAPAPAPGAAPEQPIVPPPVTEQPAPAPVVGEQQPAPAPVTGDPLDLLAAV